MATRVNLTDAIDGLREGDRALRLRGANEMSMNADAIARTFGDMLDAFDDIAAKVGSERLLGHVDASRTALERLVHGLRGLAASMRY